MTLGHAFRSDGVRRSVAVLLLLPGLVSCAPRDFGGPLIVRRDSAGVRIVEAMRPLWGDATGWSIDPDPLVDLTFSGSGPSHEFFRVRSLRQGPDGSLVVADGGSQEVRRYSSTGAFLGSVGGPGGGPGEFGSLWMAEVSADNILAVDQRGRVTVLAPDLAPTHTFEIPQRTFDIHDLNDGTVLLEVYRPGGRPELQATVRVVRRPWALFRYDLEGALIDSLGEMAGWEEAPRVIDGSSVSGPPLFGRQAHVAADGNAIFYGSADLMEVRELSLTGDVVRILRIPGYLLSLTDEEIDAERAAQFDARVRPGAPVPPIVRRFIEELPAPATRPAYADILTDPSGAVWLELYRGRSEQDRPQAWLVLDADGTWLGTVAVPDGFAVMDITMEAVLGVWTDELDVEHPQVLGLARSLNER